MEYYSSELYLPSLSPMTFTLSVPCMLRMKFKGFQMPQCSLHSPHHSRPKFCTGNLKYYQYLKVNVPCIYWKYFQARGKMNLGFSFFWTEPFFKAKLESGCWFRLTKHICYFFLCYSTVLKSKPVLKTLKERIERLWQKRPTLLWEAFQSLKKQFLFDSVLILC